MKQLNSREQQAIKTRLKIIKAALKHFAEHGLHGTNLKNISVDLGIADGLVYHYFPGGKEELYKVVTEEALKNISQDEIERKKQIDALPLEEALEQVYQYLLNIIETHRNELKLLLKKAMNILENNPNFALNLDCNNKKIIRELEIRRDKGEITASNLQAASYMINSIFINYIFAKINETNNIYLDDELNRKQLINSIVMSLKN